MNQKGYVIQIVLIVFAIIIGLMIFPVKFPKKGESPNYGGTTSEGNCIVGQVPEEEEVLEGLPAIKDVFMPAEADFSGGEPIYGGPDPNEQATYMLIRKNVPTLQKSIDGNDFLAVEGSTGWPHSVNYGEVAQKPGYIVFYPSRWGEIDNPKIGRKYVRNLGLLMLSHKVPLTGSVIGKDTVYLVDVYQDKRIYNRQNDYTTEDLFICNTGTGEKGIQVQVPPQRVSEDKKQLQLEWFLFQGPTWGVHCKPAIYLYPPQKQLVNVKVFPKGELSYTDPPYDNEKGWTVWADPLGRLQIPNSQFQIPNVQYDYLYYESKLLDSEIKKPTKGWVVKSDGLEELFSRVLPELGLNQKEQKDFMDYWLGKLQESPYYYVGLVEKEQRDYLEPLSVTPNPKTSIRFSLYFEMLDQPKEVEAPIIETPIRNGFTLVDWGGMIKLHPGTPFTCSQ